MYDETNVPPPEYRVRTVVRYIVTRYCHPYRDSRRVGLDDQPGCGVDGGSRAICEVDNENRAWEIAQALANQEGATIQLS